MTAHLVSNPLKAWLSEFLFTRELFKGPNGRPLFSYQVSEQEYCSLIALLKQHLNLASHPLHSGAWAACFCLFVSEHYRRKYNGVWSWAGPEAGLETTLTPQQHAHLTSKGLEYWRRPIRQKEGGRDWLGSLFAEGGLPWALVQSETHGFGRAVRRGIKHFYRTEGNRRTTTDLMADFEHDLPITFRNLDTRQLLAGIVEQLMHLVEHYPLKDQVDPAAYLDQSAPGWTSDFPIPLDESNARGLINDWLRDAGQRRQDRKEALERVRAFTCEHRLQGQLPNWTIRTELILPSEATVLIDLSQLSSTRLELGFYEGEELVARGGAVYGQLTENALKIRFPNPQITLTRRENSAPVSMRLLENGRPVHPFHFDGSALDVDDYPLVFESRDAQWCLVATASCALAANQVRVRVPAGFDIEPESVDISVVCVEADGAQWLDTKEELCLRKGDERYQIELNQMDAAANKPTLSGTYADFDSSPTSLFLGWPQLDLPENFAFRHEELQIFANGRRVDSLNNNDIAGLVRYAVRTKDGKTILQRRFAVLPKDFSLSLFPAINNQAARLQLRGGQHLNLNVAEIEVSVRQVDSEQGITLHLQHSGDAPPASFVLEVSHEHGGQPVQLRLPYPYQGARLIGPNNQPSSARELMIVELMGLRIALTSGLTQGQLFHMQLELICETTPHPKRDFALKVGQAPVMLNLISYQNDMLQMLGAVDEQDAHIRLTLETEKRLLMLNIRRYNGRIQKESKTAFTICSIATTQILDGARVEAMLISDPKQVPLQLEERTTQGVGTGFFESALTMERSGPWLIYPAKDSRIQFRPQLYVPAIISSQAQGDARSLHHATELYHPVHNSLVIDQQIAKMANDFSHSGWQYLADLKQHYGHLPLSSFESWLALSRTPSALALAVFRLDMDEAFCGRIRDELAVIWECIPLPQWVETYALFRAWLRETGLPEAMISSLEQNRRVVLRFVVSGFDHLGDYLINGERGELTKVPVDKVLPGWYQDLRKHHEADSRWPTELGKELSAWIDRQFLPPLVKALSLVDFTDAVTYLPIFMAYVSAGRAKLSDLPVALPYLKFAIRMVSDFDRQGWYTCVHAMMVSYLLASDDEV